MILSEGLAQLAAIKAATFAHAAVEDTIDDSAVTAVCSAAESMSWALA